MDYPSTVAEIIEDVEYPAEIIHAVKQYAKMKPWKGSEEERKEKLLQLHSMLNSITGLNTRLQFTRNLTNGGGYFTPSIDTIHLYRDVSVLTYLHEYSHALNGRSEREACRWSINLFRKVFPKSYAKLVADRHVLRRPGVTRPGA